MCLRIEGTKYWIIKNKFTFNPPSFSNSRTLNIYLTTNTYTCYCYQSIIVSNSEVANLVATWSRFVSMKNFNVMQCVESSLTFYEYDTPWVRFQSHYRYERVIFAAFLFLYWKSFMETSIVLLYHRKVFLALIKVSGTNSSIRQHNLY